MTPEDKKMLTEEVLGECEHEWASVGKFYCLKCDQQTWQGNRTFTTDADMLVVFRIFDKGKWDEFYWWAVKYFTESKDDIGGGNSSYMRWLLDNPERACCLAAMFLEEQG